MNADSHSGLHGTTFVDAFIEKSYRERLLLELQWRDVPTRRIERRGRFLSRFNHDALKYLDPRFILPLRPPNSDPSFIFRFLVEKGAPETCFVISSADAIDGRVLGLAKAPAIAVGFGMPTIISCLPGRLAYLETEQVAGPPDRYILFRTAPVKQHQL